MLVAAFEGWNDAGDAASGAVRYLIERNDAELVADIDPEEFFDFTSTRPQVEIDDEGVRHIEWPTISFYAVHLPGGAGDALLLLGHRAPAPVAYVLRRQVVGWPRRQAAAWS